MSLVSLAVRNFRLYESAGLEPGKGLNLITGHNAGGKTSLLEAIHFLGTGKSFKSTTVDGLLSHQQQQMSVWGRVEIGPMTMTELSIAITPEGRTAKIAGDSGVKISDMAQLLPHMVISPDSHFEFHQHAKARRAAIDWALFHVEPSYSTIWSRYRRALEQRNAALRDPKQARTRYSWDEEIAKLGDEIQRRRNESINTIKTRFCSISAHMLEKPDEVDVVLDPGWKTEAGMLACLQKDRDRDLARGFTHSGPQRNDLMLMIDGHPAKNEASHGQNKLLVIALRLAMVEHLLELTGKACCLLVDDLPAELDEKHRDRFCEYVSRLPVQQFITATDPDMINANFWQDRRRFHVEHGSLRTV